LVLSSSGTKKVNNKVRTRGERKVRKQRFSWKPEVKTICTENPISKAQKEHIEHENSILGHKLEENWYI
jgi:hypothetical protein